MVWRMRSIRQTRLCVAMTFQLTFSSSFYRNLHGAEVNQRAFFTKKLNPFPKSHFTSKCNKFSLSLRKGAAKSQFNSQRKCAVQLKLKYVRMTVLRRPTLLILLPFSKMRKQACGWALRGTVSLHRRDNDDTELFKYLGGVIGTFDQRSVIQEK